MKQVDIEIVRRMLTKAPLNVDETSKINRCSNEDLLDIDLVTDLRMDSLDIVEMTMYMEHELGICIDDEAYNGLKNNSTIRNYIECCNAHATERH